MIEGRSELIDKENRIWRFHYEDEEQFLVVSEVIRTHYLRVVTAKNFSERINAMLEFIDQAKAFIPIIPKEWEKDLQEVDMLIESSGGARTDALIRHRLHRILSKLMGNILKNFYQEGRIAHKKVPREVIGQEYSAPHTDDFNLEKKYRESLEPKEEGENNA